MNTEDEIIFVFIEGSKMLDMEYDATVFCSEKLLSPKSKILFENLKSLYRISSFSEFQINLSLIASHRTNV